MKSLIVASLLASAASLIAVAAPNPSGTYGVACNFAATPHCQVVFGSRLVNNATYTEAGYLEYTDGLFENGWDIINVVLNTTSPQTLDEGYYAMGFVEGFVTHDRIYKNYVNVKDEFTDALTPEVKDWWEKNYKFVTALVADQPKDPFAAKVGNIIQQIKGMAAGYIAGWPDNQAPAIDELMMFYINWQAEIGDISSAFAPESEFAKNWWSPENQHCSALIKVTPTDLFVSHVAWTGYSWMMRQYKTYTFEGTNFVTLAGHPGMIHSMDDWYMTGHGLAVIETTIIVNNPSLYVDNIVGKYNSVPAFIRVMVANYISESTTSWMANFARLNSGTYNNQWMSVDMKLYNGNSKDLPDGLFGVIETLPGSYVSGDQTQFLRNTGAWPSYNFAFYPDIQNLANYSGQYDEYGYGMTFSGYNRARIFARDAHKVVDLPTMEAMMTYNNYLKDDLSIIPNCKGATLGLCKPDHSAMLSISSRGDLMPPGGVEQYGIMYKMVGQRNHGGIDVKIASYSGMMKNNGSFAAHVKNGPTTSNGLPPFNFTAFPMAVSRFGLPEVVNFPINKFTTTPRVRVPARPVSQPEDQDNMGMGAALLIISLIVIVSSVVLLIVCRFMPKRAENRGYSQVQSNSV